MTLYMIGFIVLRLLGMAFFVILLIRLAMGLRRRGDGALASLERRYAAGELSDEDFRRMREVLES